MMSFQDFLEHAAALFRKKLPDPDLDFSKTHVFHLGEDDKIEEGIKEIWEDLKGDMEKRVPLPFQDTSCVSVVQAPNLPGSPKGWILDRILEAEILPQDYEMFRKWEDLIPGGTPAQQEAARRPKQKLIVLRVEEFSDYIASWCAYYFGATEGKMILSAVPSEFMTLQNKKVTPYGEEFLLQESRAVIKQAAAISHPANYVLQVTPSLTPKEERKVAQGRERPVRKMPHFVVVDHDILVSMNPKNSTGTHASPAPHERRGHWRRLAEHCRHARLLGREKVWVRPAYVGETEFSDGKNHYEVLMDFGKKPTAAVLG